MSKRQARLNGRDSSSFPLSFSQHRIWLLNQLHPNNPCHNIPVVVRLKGPLIVTILKQSLEQIFNRHQVLRATFTPKEGQPIQSFSASAQLNLLFNDLRQTPDSDREAEAWQIIINQARRPFDLSQGPLYRTLLIQLTEEEHLLLLVVHHIICDEWSSKLLMRELAVLYDNITKGIPAPLSETTSQYSDFVRWQHENLQGEVLQRHLSYWKQQLDGSLFNLKLPKILLGTVATNFSGARQMVTISKFYADALKSTSQHHNVTLYMTLLAAFITLLYRYTGQNDVVIGSPIPNRSHDDTAALVGHVENILILRTALADNLGFVELLDRVRKVVQDAFAHQDLPVEILIQELQPEHNTSFTPLFNVMFALKNAPSESIEISGITWTPQEIDIKTAKYDLTLELRETSNGLRGWLEYNTELFDAPAINRMRGHLQTLIENIVTNPEMRLSELQLLTRAEQNQLLVDWNVTCANYPKDLCLHELFEAQAKQTPDTVAVVFKGNQCSYQELNNRANQLAHHLRALGVASEALIGIYMERSLEMIAGILGALKAGCAYVPLDPYYPKERLALMLEEIHAPVVLTQQRLLDSLPQHNMQVICLDPNWKTIDNEPIENPINRVLPDNLAYVIYTSGSTGKPKGVCCSHTGVINLLQDFNRRKSISIQDGCSLWTSLSFDVSVYEIFSALLAGGTLNIVPENLRCDSIAFFDWLSDQKIHSTYIPPFMLQDFKAWVMKQSKPCFLHRLLVGVEPINESLLAEIHAQLPHLHVINGYGPTEATVCSTLYDIQAQNTQDRNTPIGKPVHNTKIYLLDSHLQPVPIGIPGELYIGGVGLARGYYNRPEQTAEKFVPSPFGNDPGARLYKTGDLARYLPDGNIEFLGRVDYQVKIRGFRIELGEIETALNNHPAIKENVVIVREDKPNAKQIVAYLVPKHIAAPSDNELRNYLKEKLPHYMIPSVFVVLNALPLNPNGKVDRRALPDPELPRPDLERTFIAPRNQIEETLAGIWAEVLGLAQVGIFDNFFELGGHSLKATQLISRVRNTFHVEIPLRLLFDRPTVASLAKNIEEEPHKTASDLQTVPLKPISRDGELPLSFAQQRLWFLNQLQPDSPFYNVPTAINIGGPLNKDILKQCLNEIVQRHEALRTIFKTKNGKPIQIIVPSVDLQLPCLDLRQVPEYNRESELSRLTKEETIQPFNLEQGPLLKTSLLQLDDEVHVLILTMHHIISDGWSMEILIRELAKLYEAFSNGNASPLTKLPIQYVDYAYWQRQWLSGNIMETQLSYWKKQLSGASQVLELATDRPRPTVQSYNGARRNLTFPRQLSDELINFSRSEGVTLFMTLLTAFNTLLYRYTGQEDILVGSPIANRNRAEIEGLIGFFVNTLVLRTDLSGNPAFRELLARVRDVTLEAFAHQDLPFEKLVEELQPARNLSYNPLVQVMFVLQSAPLGTVELPGLTMNLLYIHTGTAKFDLTVELWETSEGIKGWFEYSTDLFDTTTIDRMIAHFQTLLEGIIANPNQRISGLPLLKQAEQHQLLVECNATRTDYPRDLCLHELFEAQVKQTPDAVAVEFETQLLSYHELNCRANQVAHYLQSLGIGPDMLVGICMQRSIEMIVAILGILKAGGAYLPLESTYPKERLAFMLEDARVSVLLTQKSLLEVIPDHNVRLICLDGDWELIAQKSKENPISGARADNLAYVIYTSGSTGKPKGVSVPHRAVNRLVLNTNYVTLAASDRVAQASNASFDAATFEIWGALVHGARLVIITRDIILSAQEFATQLHDQKISVLFLTTALFNQLAREVPWAFKSLRYLLFGGEAVDPRWCKNVIEKDPPQLLLHVYGPTENTTFTSWYPVQAVTEGVTTIPIGRPISNTEIYVLDRNLEPVPVGIPGELYIGGDGLARNYFNRPELTAAMFIPDPFSNRAGSRLYRTGDLVRVLPDLNIEFLGRFDHQVKLRGFRVELGEIENLLNQHPAIHEAVVILREDLPDDKRLVAYFVPDPQRPVSAKELRAWLKEKLPDYMVPSVFVSLDALPLTPNGKVDRRALPAPGSSRPEMEKAYVAPRTDIERILANIWATLLGLEKVGVHDNFFELGGHSLLATQIISRVFESFQIELPLRSFFETPTVAGLAITIVQNMVKRDLSEEISAILTELEQLSDHEI